MKVFICQWITILCLLSLTSALELYHLLKVVDFVKNITSGEIEQRLKPRGIHDQNTIFDDDLSKFSRRPWTKPTMGGRLPDVWNKAYEKARKLVQKMELVEKVNLTTGTGWGSGPCVGNTGSVPRFEINSICLQDGPNGVRFTEFVTHFPSGLATASTFNKALSMIRGKAIGKEHRKKGVHIVLGPSVGPIGLKAAGGRNWESFGADPYLQGILGSQTVIGMQSEGVIAVVKHLIGNEQENFRQVDEWSEIWDCFKSSINSNIGDRAMHEIYLWPFADAINAGVGGVMCSYNRVNATYACENSYLMNHLIKAELGFQGFIVSDWGAQHTGVYSALAGLDMSMPGEISNDWSSGKSHWGPLLTKAVYNNTISQDRLNDMVLRILTPFFANDRSLPTGDDVPNFSSWTSHTYGQQYPFQDYGPIVQENLHIDARSKFSTNAALAVAREAIVLLKNEGRNLPIARVDGVRRILIAGVGAGPNPKGWNCKDQKCVDGVLTSGWGSASVNNPYVITPYEAISKKAIEQNMIVDYCNDVWDLDHIEDLADFADMAIVIVNACSGEGYIQVDDNYGDRRNLSLWHNGDELIRRIAENCRKTVVVVNSVGPVDMNSWIGNENVVAVLYSAPLGQFVGQAIAEVLFGDINPSGKLPFTIARKKSHYVPIIRELTEKSVDDNFDRDIYLDYRFFDKHNIHPLFEFGFGLSYTSFEVSNLQIKEIKHPQQYLPCPPDYLPAYHLRRDDTCDPEDVQFPHWDFSPVPGYIYPYLYNSHIYDSDEFDYPYGYCPEPENSPPLAGGGLGGNSALWDVVYEVTASVKNTGPVQGAFVAQLYIGFPCSIVVSPPKVLRGFDKVFLEPNQEKSVKFELKTRDLSIWEPYSQQWIVQPGTYKLFISSSSRKSEICGELEIKANAD